MPQQSVFVPVYVSEPSTFAGVLTPQPSEGVYLYDEPLMAAPDMMQVPSTATERTDVAQAMSENASMFPAHGSGEQEHVFPHERPSVTVVP